MKVLLTLSLLILSSSAFADNSSAPSWETIHEQLQIERSKLFSGTFLGEGVETKGVDRSSRTFKLAGRFDDTLPAFWLKKTFELEREDRQGNERLILQVHCRRTNDSVYFSNLNNIRRVTLLDATSKPPDDHPGCIGFFDPRALGFLPPYDLFSGVDFRAALSQWDSDREVNRIDANELEVSFIAGKGRARVVMTIAVDGYRLTDLVTYSGILKDGRFVLNSELIDEQARRLLTEKGVEFDAIYPDVTTKLNLRWMRQADVWVPTSISIENTEMPQQSNASNGLAEIIAPKNSFYANFVWSAINQPLEESSFVLPNLGLPGSSPVFDFRSKPPRLLGPVSSFGSQTIEPKHARSSRILFGMAAIGIVLIALGLKRTVLRR